MNITTLQNGYAFDSEKQVLGQIAGIDFINSRASIVSGDSVVTSELEDLVFLPAIGFIGDYEIINRDVVATVDGKLHELVLTEDGKTVKMFSINSNKEQVEMVDSFDVAIFADGENTLKSYVTFVGNIFEIELDAKPEFNIIVVRMHTEDEGIKFFYACNNKENEEIDLIKVVFIGHHTLTEENYTRVTLTYDEYQKQVDAGLIKETSPHALSNLALGQATSQPSQSTSKAPITEAPLDEEEEDEDYCETCNNNDEDCKCW